MSESYLCCIITIVIHEVKIIYDESELMPELEVRRARARERGLVGLLIRTGFARNVKQAERILKIFVVVVLALSLYLFIVHLINVVSIKKTPKRLPADVPVFVRRR